MDQTNDRVVVIIGGRVGGNLAAAYLKKTQPDLDVVVIDRPDKAPPLVGESTIEGTTLFLHECGLAKLLQEKHFHKFGLTFYFKLDPDAPGDRRYSIHEEPAIPPLPAALVNRFTFDRDVRAINRENGVTCHEGHVEDVQLRRGGHTVTWLGVDGIRRESAARWVVDASGRHRFLGKKLGLSQKNDLQRSWYWFRLADFDPSILLGLNAEMRSRYPCMREQIAYDPYFVTHHFMGKGNWIWCIPVATEDGRRLISIGITFFMCRYHTDPRGVRLMTRMMVDSERAESSAWDLFRLASKELGTPGVKDVFNWYNDTINYRLITDKEHELPVHLGRMAFLNARIRLATLRQARWRDSSRQVSEIARDLTTGLLLRTVFRDAALRQSRGFQLLIGA
jgi:flavin-dependent dehydrogenase